MRACEALTYPIFALVDLDNLRNLVVMAGVEG